jgi:aryl-alcohol dehydrogenase-like predicted oxidoreductase
MGEKRDLWCTNVSRKPKFSQVIPEASGSRRTQAPRRALASGRARLRGIHRIVTAVSGPARHQPYQDHLLREAVDLGITHIDTSDFYGPVVVNELIREALHPYPAGLRIVTKVGARRGPDGSWRPSLARADLTAQIHENLEHLALDALDVVNLRLPEADHGEQAVAEPFGTLAELRKEGLIRHLGLSAASSAQLDQAQAIRPVVTVQNLYNVAARQDDALVDRCAACARTSPPRTWSCPPTRSRNWTASAGSQP